MVVIAIIAILAAMLLPALSAARERARSASCLSNVKQHLTATIMYAGDNKDMSPNIWNPDTNNIGAYSSPSGLGVLYIQGYNESVDTYYCPSGTHFNKDTHFLKEGDNGACYAGYSHIAWQFNYNVYDSYRLSGNYPKFAQTGEAPSSPSSMPACGDILFANGGGANSLAEKCWQGYHGKSFNIGWADGHADAFNDTAQYIKKNNSDWHMAIWAWEYVWHKAEGKSCHY